MTDDLLTINSICSVTVRSSIAKSCCGTKPDILAIKSAPASLPLSMRYPLIALLSRRLMAAKSVVLPAPLEPIRATRLPEDTTPLTESKDI